MMEMAEEGSVEGGIRIPFTNIRLFGRRVAPAPTAPAEPTKEEQGLIRLRNSQLADRQSSTEAGPIALGQNRPQGQGKVTGTLQGDTGRHAA